jgi:hypothetical protein
MSSIRITKMVLSNLNIMDESTYPTDLKHWVMTRGLFSSAPWYLSPDDVKYFLMMFSWQEYRERKSKRIITKYLGRRPSFLEPLGVQQKV